MANPLVYLLYRDHILFRNSKHRLYQPVLRETVGWLVKENGKAVWILWDRSVTKLPQQKDPQPESGLVLLKNCILEMKKLA